MGSLLERETRLGLRKSFLNKLCPSGADDWDDEIETLVSLENGGLPVLRLLEEPSVQDQIVHDASTALNFMNHLRPKWAPRFDDDDCHIMFFCAESNSILMVKDDEERSVYKSKDMVPILKVLFHAFKVPFKPHPENRYIMKCVMRILCFSEISREVGLAANRFFSFCLEHIFVIIHADALVNHYLFESIAVLFKRIFQSQSQTEPGLVSIFEINIIPKMFSLISQCPSTKVWAYAYQIVALFVEWSSQPLASQHHLFFEQISSPRAWYMSEYFPALLRLLQAFFQKLPHFIRKHARPTKEYMLANMLAKVVAIFNMLILSSTYDQQGFYLLNTLIDSLHYDEIHHYMPHIWYVVFLRLKDKSSLKFVKSLVISMSLFLVKYGSERLVETLDDSPRQSEFLAILEQFWIPTLKLITGELEIKLTAVASIRLISESPALLHPAAVNIWAEMLGSIVTLLSLPEDDRAKEEREMPEIAQNMNYILYYAGTKELDPLKDITDPKELLITSVEKINAKYPWRYSQIIKKLLEPANQGLNQLFYTLQS